MKTIIVMILMLLSPASFAEFDQSTYYPSWYTNGNYEDTIKKYGDKTKEEVLSSKGVKDLPINSLREVASELSYRDAYKSYYEKRKMQKLAEEEAKLQNALKIEMRDAELLAGSKPKDFREAQVYHRADNGMFLASAPKIRPDRRTYALNGKIEFAEQKPEFMARADFETRNINYQVISVEARYYLVRIPKSMRDRYFDSAKIGGFFNLVGRYTGNSTYTTTDGTVKSMPVFDALYFDL